MSRVWKPRPARQLPEGLILFDGTCVLCSWWVRFVVARDGARRFRFVPIQTDYGRQLAARLGIDPDMPSTNAVILGGTAYFKSDAAVCILAGLPRWGWVRLLGGLPRSWRDRAYDAVAANRYRLFGRHASCALPGPEFAGRILTGPPDGAGSP